MKNLESISQGYDNSVRNDQNSYVQMRYGDDNLNTHMCETQTYKHLGYTDKQFAESYYVDYQAKLASQQQASRR